jgi:hypothetical protein
MSRTLAAKLQLIMSASYLNPASDVSSRTDSVAKSVLTDLVDGTGASAAQVVYSTTGTIASGATTTLDLAGSLTDAFGSTVTFTKVKYIYIGNTSTVVSHNLVVGNAAAPIVDWVGAGTHTITVKYGGFLLLSAPGTDGYTITAGSADSLKLAATATLNATYEIIIVGEGSVSA